MLPFSSSSLSSTLTPFSKEQPTKSKSKTEAEEELVVHTLIPSLPDDIALNSLARVPRPQHQTLSQVSKPIRSLLSSPLFFNTRSMLRCTEHIIYVAFFSSNGSFRWFALYKNPNVLVPVPDPPFPFLLIDAAYAVVGPKIYAIGGCIDDGIPTPQVWVLDCRFNQWRPGPTMLVAHKHPSVNVVDGKIYVMGGIEAGSGIWAEVLDPAIGRWDEVPSPIELWNENAWLWSMVVDNKIYILVDDVFLAYDTCNRVWESVDEELSLGWRGSGCVVNGILYCFGFPNKIKVLDVKQIIRRGGVCDWKELNGLEEVVLPVGDLTGVGGNLFLVWTCLETGKENPKETWCVEVEVNMNGDAELRSKVCWSHKIVSRELSFGVKCLSVVL